MTTSIRNICIKNIYIGSFYTINTWIGYSGIRSISIKGIVFLLEVLS